MGLLAQDMELNPHLEDLSFPPLLPPLFLPPQLLRLKLGQLLDQPKPFSPPTHPPFRIVGLSARGAFLLMFPLGHQLGQPGQPCQLLDQ